MEEPTPLSSDAVRGDAPLEPPQRSLFVRNLGWSFIGGITSSGVLFLLNIVAGRVLGPGSYGSAQYAVTIAQFFIVATSLGFDVACNRTLPRTTDPEERRTYVSTMLATLCVSFLVLTIAVAVARRPLARLLSTSDAVVIGAAVYAVIFGLRNALDRAVSGLERFRLQSMARPIEALVAAGTFAVYVSFFHRDFHTMLSALTGGAFALLATYLLALRGSLKVRSVTTRAFSQLWSYGRIALLHGITPLGLAFADKLAVQRELGASALGLYSAYVTVSVLVVTQVLAVTTNVLFPHAAQQDDKTDLVRRLRRLQLQTFVPVWLLIALTVVVLITLFGSQYPLLLRWVVLSSLWAALVFYNGLMTVVTITHSPRSYFETVVFQAVRSAVVVLSLFVLAFTNTLSVTTVLAGLAAVEVLDLVNLRTIVNRHVLASVGSEGGRERSEPD